MGLSFIFSVCGRQRAETAEAALAQLKVVTKAKCDDLDSFVLSLEVEFVGPCFRNGLNFDVILSSAMWLTGSTPGPQSRHVS